MAGASGSMFAEPAGVAKKGTPTCLRRLIETLSLRRTGRDHRPSRADAHSPPRRVSAAQRLLAHPICLSHPFTFRSSGSVALPYFSYHPTSSKHWSALGTLDMSGPTTTVNSASISLADLWDPLYDSFDVDLIMKVLAHTVFSE